MKLMNIKTILIGLGIMSMLLGACASKKKKDFTYFNNLPNDSVLVIPDNTLLRETRLMPGDIITIRVSTLDEKATELFNQGVLNRSSFNGSQTSTLQTEGYMLDKNGDINFPLFGLINLKGKTLEEAQKIVTQKVVTEVKNPIVNIRLQNAIVTVMGEVGKPGPINISDRPTTVLEAIGRAGDIQPTGKKDDVKVIRRNGNQTEYAILNLNDITSTHSRFYYLQQGDIVVVNSTHVKERVVRGGLDNQQTIYLIIGGLSSLASISTVLILYNRNN
jgi:polysaccharide export outer membrane protein